MPRVTGNTVRVDRMLRRSLGSCLWEVIRQSGKNDLGRGADDIADRTKPQTSAQLSRRVES